MENSKAIELLKGVAVYADTEFKAALNLGIAAMEQREKAFDEWCTDCKEYDHNRNCCPRYNRVIRGAVDVVPVRLGEWLDGYKMQTCSLCKCRGKKSWTFCPHCGARMIYGKREE